MNIWNDFVKQVDNNSETYKIEGIYILHKGKAIFEHRWTFDRPRNIYSHTKSFLSTAIGIAIADGYFSLDDKLVDIFAENIPANADANLEKITVRHLLTMSSGFSKALLMIDGRRAEEGYPDYLTFMLSQPIVDKPGSKFVYSSGDSYLLGRIIEKKLNIHLMQYIYNKILKPLEIPLPVWESCPEGHPLGGSGMFLKLTDMAKLGQLYLDKGKYNNTQIVSSDWVAMATSKQIENIFPDNIESLESPWHGKGYGYQFWLSEYPNSFRADGAFGQISLVLPEKEMVIAVQCPEDGTFENIKNLLHETILKI